MNMTDTMLAVRPAHSRNRQYHVFGLQAKEVGGLPTEATDIESEIALRQLIKSLEHEVHTQHEAGNRQAEANALGNLGNIQYMLGDFSRAISCYTQCLKLVRWLNDTEGEGAVLENLGNIFMALGEPEKAIAFYRQARDIRCKLNDHPGEANTLNNLGHALLFMREQRQALICFEQELTIRQQLDDQAGAANALHNQATTYAEMGKQQQALGLYIQSLHIARVMDDRQTEAMICWNIGLVYKKQKNLPRAIDYMQSAVEGMQALGYEYTADYAAQVEQLRRQLEENEKALRPWEQVRQMTGKLKEAILGAERPNDGGYGR